MRPEVPRPVRRAALANTGCKVNQSEMDAVERLLRARGAELVDGHEAADLVVVNTCTVTSIADRKSRQAVRRARRTNPDALVLVTGCSVAIDPESLSAADPSARLFDNESKSRLLEELAGLLEPGGGAPMPTISGVEWAVEPEPGPGVRARGRRGFGRGRLRRSDRHRSNPRLRQDPGRLLVPLHLLHHSPSARVGALHRRR